MAQTQRETRTQGTPPTTPLREGSYELYIPPRFHWERTRGEEEKPKENGTRKLHGGRYAAIPVVAVYDNGECKHFQSAGRAAMQRVGKEKKWRLASNILDCCGSNRRRSPLKGAKLGEPSSDHRAHGVRYYFETDNVWRTKVGESVKERENKLKTQIWRQWL